MSRLETALKYFNEQRTEVDARINKDIDLYRKGEMEINIVSSAPLIDDIVIEVNQKSHEFKFGANIFMLDEFENEEKNALYREKFPQIFNLATLPFYWKSLEPTKGNYRFEKGCPKIYRRPAIDLCLEYCAEKGIEPKAHCLNYDYFRPNWLYDAEPTEHKAALENHFKVLAERYGSLIPSWEVTNETFNVTFADCFLKPNYSKFYLHKDFNEWSFKTAEKYFKNNHLIINDHLDFGCMRSLHGEYFGERSPYFLEIERLGAQGVDHLDSIGFQYHCFFAPEQEADLCRTRYNPKHLFDVLDTYQKLGKKLQITELTISAFSDTAEDEQVQAELVKNLYKVFFSHPAMEAIIYWNLVDGYASGRLGAMKEGENKYYGGLMNFDMTEKPAYKVLNQLINEEWHTSLTLKPQKQKAKFKGFYGDYEIKIHIGEKEIILNKTLSSKNNNLLTIEV